MAAVDAVASSQSRAKRRRVLGSVFKGHSPQTLSRSNHPPAGTGASFLASPPVSQPVSVFAHHHANSAQLERAWTIVTTKLRLPALVLDRGLDDEPSFPSFASPDEPADFNSALQLLVAPRQLHVSQTYASEYDLLAWFDHEVRCHFAHHVLPRLAELSKAGMPAVSSRNEAYTGCMAVIRNAVRMLRAATNQYSPRIKVILDALQTAHLPGDAEPMFRDRLSRFSKDVQAMVTNSFDTIIKPITLVLARHVAEALELPNSRMRTHIRGASDQEIPPEMGLIGMVEVLEEAGLAGEKFQVLFAEIMDRTMTQYIHRIYARVWKTSSRHATSGLSRDAAKSLNVSQTSWCIASLCDWVENQFGRVALLVLSKVEKSSPRSNIVFLADVQQWKEIGIGRLAALRISELFDVVLQWPASKGALDDLKASVTSPQRRWELTTAFSAALQKRLLHPARSTLDILRFYVSMIRTFHELDHSKVLLSRVVPSLQLYLVQRDDAVRMVVHGLLANPEEVERAQKAALLPSAIDAEGGSRGASGKLVELAVLLNDPDQERRMDIDEEDLDWDDMEWVPDPVDAGVNYKRPKSEDVIGTLINTLGSEDVFIKEFQNIISEHLLSTQTEFAQEQKLLDLLKRRFGEAAVQNCEVMIKDIHDSRKVDAHIRRIELGQPPQPPRLFGTPPVFLETSSRQLDADEEMEGQVPYHARILSRLYWPDMVQETFNLPASVADIQTRYGQGYQRLKPARKLTFLHQLGQATVELELEDRTVSVDCRTFEAAVIYAFQTDEGANDTGHHNHSPMHKSVLDLQAKLEMDEELVLQAVDFWVSQGVLVRYSTDPDTYTVLERKDSPPTRPELHPSMSAPGALEGEQHDMPPKPAGVKRAGTTSAMDAKENERRAIYWQFIVGMLTNSMATMPLAQMAMMLRMVIPDGLPWSDQELQEFLLEKVAGGELEVVGGKYRLVKK